MDVERGKVVERVREQVERAGVARDAHAARREHVPELVVPEILGQATRQPHPPHVASGQSVHVAELVERAPERRQTGRVALGEPCGQPVEEQVDRAWRLGCRWPSLSGLGGLTDARLVAEATGEHRRRDRLEMGLASHRGIERFEAPGGMEQQGRSVAAAGAGERDLRAQPLQPGALELVERSKLGGRQQLERRVLCRNIELRLRRSQGPPAPLRRIGCQLRRPCQERRSRRRAPTGPRPVGRALQLAGHRLVNTHRRVSTMPRPSIGVGIRDGRLRQRPVRSSPLGRRRRPIHSGSDQWVAEAHTGADLDQLRVLCRGERAPFDAERLSRAPDERRVTDRLGRGQQQQSLCCLGQLTGALVVLTLELAREVCRSEKLEAAGQLRCAHTPRQIEQRKRVAPGFRHDAVADAVIEPTRDGAHEQGARVLVREPA